MSDINNLTITGRLPRDAEQRATQSGTSVLSFSVANSTGYGDKEKTNWFSCSIFGKRAEGKLAQYLTKGTQVTITGEVSLNEYEGQNGHKANLQVFVKDLTFSGCGQQSQQQAPQQQAPQQQADDFDDDIPW